MDEPVVTLTHPAHGTFAVRAESLADTIFRVGHASLLLLQRDIAGLVGVDVGFDGSSIYSDLGRAEALIVLTYLRGGSAD